MSDTTYAPVPVREVQYCTFTIGNMLFGVEVLCVQEVLDAQQLTQMPLASDVVRGLINLRGQIVTAIDLRAQLGLPPRDENEVTPSGQQGSMNVVVRTRESAFSLLVDEIGDVINVDERSFEAPPETLTGAARDLILGAHKLDNRLLLVLDIEQAVNFTNPVDTSN